MSIVAYGFGTDVDTIDYVCVFGFGIKRSILDSITNIYTYYISSEIRYALIKEENRVHMVDLNYRTGNVDKENRIMVVPATPDNIKYKEDRIMVVDYENRTTIIEDS